MIPSLCEVPMPFDESKFQRAQARYDEMEPPDDEMPSDDDVFDLLWGVEGPQTPKQAETTLKKIARSIKCF
jgi:hypothetical protein